MIPYKSYARSVAGVHYETDNMAGLNLGQEIIADYLPRYLRRQYGANRQNAEKKIEKLRFRWEDFDPRTCSAKSKYS